MSEPSDEEAPTLSAESGDMADEDTPGPDLPQEDGVDLLGLHSEAGPVPPMQARGGPPSNADLLSRLLGAPAAAPEGAAGGLFGGDAALLFISPASAPSTRTTVPAGRCRRQEWARRSRQSAVQGDREPPEDLLRQAGVSGVSALPLPLGATGSWEGRPGADPLGRGCALWCPRSRAPASWCPATADPFDPLLLPSDPDAQPHSQPDLFGEFLNSDSPATLPASFPATHSAPPLAHGTNFLHLGKCGLHTGGGATGPGEMGSALLPPPERGRSPCPLCMPCWVPGEVGRQTLGHWHVASHGGRRPL